MKKVLFTLLLTGLVTLTCACGSKKQESADAEDLGVISSNKVEVAAESVAESVVPEEPVEVEEEVEETLRDYTGFYAYYPDDMNQMAQEVNITSQNGDVLGFDYNYYNMRTAGGTNPLFEQVVDNVVTFSAGIYGGHGAEGKVFNFQMEFIDENTLLFKNLDQNEVWTLTKQDPAATDESADAAAPAEETYPSGYAPSVSGELSWNDIIGKYASDNGNVYSVNFYTSSEDERVGIIYLNKDPMSSACDENDEIVASETNVYFVYGTQNAFVFDYDGVDYKLSYYKDGKLWDVAVLTQHYQPS